MERDDAPSTNQIDGMLNKLEQRIDTLKRRYERYFLGLEQRPPSAMHKQVVREVHEAENTHITNTAQRFKLRSLVQRFNTHKTRWNRIKRKIEEGTYHRDQKRAKRRQERKEAAREEPEDDVVEIDPDEDFIEDLDEMELDEVFDQAVAADQQQTQQKSVDERTPEEKERIKQQKLAEIQRKLGIDGNQPEQGSAPAQSAPASSPSTAGGDQSSAGGGEASGRKAKLEAMRQKLGGKGKKSASSTKSASTGGGQSSGGGADSGGSGRQAKLQRLKQKLDREKGRKKRAAARKKASKGAGGGRRKGSKRGSDPNREVYEKFVEAKRKCNEPTDNLSYDAVKKSMDRQRDNLKKKRGAKKVDFDVVIKDGQAFLKPDPKE